MKKLKVKSILAALLACAMLAGCSSTPGSSGSSTPESKPADESKTSSTASEDVSSEGGEPAEDGIVFDEKGRFVKYDPPITLSTNVIVSSSDSFHEGCDIQNNGWTQWMEEKLGIKWEMKYISPDDESNSQKLDLAFASDDLPDVISSASVSQITKYAQAGKMTALDEYIEKAPAIVRYYVDDAVRLTQGAFFAPFTVNGKVYAMPMGNESIEVATSNFLRTDILKELNMDVPETISDLDALFAAYHEKYPQGRAIAMDKGMGGIDVVASAYGAAKDAWIEKDGKLEYSYIQPEMKQTLAKMAEYYQKGYIDPEFIVKDGDKLNEDVINGNVLIYNGPWWCIATPMTPMWNNLPEATTVGAPFIKGDDGTCTVTRSTWWTNNRAITAKCENPEAVFYLFGDNLDSYNRNVQQLRDTLKEEYDYEFKYPVTEVLEATNAEQVAKDHPNIGQPIQLYLYEYPEELEGCGYMNDFYTLPNFWLGFSGKFVSVANLDFETMTEALKTGDESVMTPYAKSMYTEWNATQPNMLKTFSGIYDYWAELLDGKDGILQVNKFAGGSTPTMTEKGAYLDKLREETFAQIIMGAQPIDSFDKYVEDWYANGGTEITQEVNDWYASTK